MWRGDDRTPPQVRVPSTTEYSATAGQERPAKSSYALCRCQPADTHVWYKAVRSSAVRLVDRIGLPSDIQENIQAFQSFSVSTLPKDVKKVFKIPSCTKRRERRGRPRHRETLEESSCARTHSRDLQ